MSERIKKGISEKTYKKKITWKNRKQRNNRRKNRDKEEGEEDIHRHTLT